MSYVNLANTQLMGRCTYNAQTGKAEFESFKDYYTDSSDIQLLNIL